MNERAILEAMLDRASSNTGAIRGAGGFFISTDELRAILWLSVRMRFAEMAYGIDPATPSYLIGQKPTD